MGKVSDNLRRAMFRARREVPQVPLCRGTCVHDNYRVPAAAWETDMHNIEWGQTPSGIETEKKLSSIRDYVELVRSGTGFSPIFVKDRKQKPMGEDKLTILKYGRDGKFSLCFDGEA